MTDPIVPAGTPPTTPPATPPTPPKEAEPEVRTVNTEKAQDYVIPEGTDLLDPKNMKEAVDKTVESRLSGIRGDIETQRIGSEVKSIIEAHPEYKPYAEKIQKWVTHPNRIEFIKKGFPVNSVVLEAIAPHLEEIGAEKARLADAKSRASGGDGKGTAPRIVDNKTDFKAMSNKDFDNLTERVKAGRV